MQRYFINSTELEFTKEQLHHIIQVMRMRINDKIEVVYQGASYIAEIKNITPFKIDLISKINDDRELKVDITLLYCLPKKDKLDFVIQKATEIGVNRIILVQSKRCVCKFQKEDYNRKLERFQKIALEASEQSHRTKIPVIEDIIDFKDIKNYSFDYSFIAYENENKDSLKNYNFAPLTSIGILIGSEGGFDLDEVTYAFKHNYKPISLGKRILRSETACIYALSVLSFLSEDL